jgi:hypothetical protein
VVGFDRLVRNPQAECVRMRQSNTRRADDNQDKTNGIAKANDSYMIRAMMLNGGSVGKLRPERMLVRCGVNAADRADCHEAGSPHPRDRHKTVDTVSEA